MKALVLYYSYSGNTDIIARKISEALDCDIARIQTVTPYSEDFDTVVKQSEKEIKKGYEPEIEQLTYNPEDYDIVILGFPVWWYTFAPPVKTALSAVNWQAKAVYTFATNEGWIGHSFKDVKNACTGADVRPGLNVRFNERGLITSQAEIDKWIGQIK
ncbi:MAG: flavodoxin [Muricomes sp.]